MPIVKKMNLHVSSTPVNLLIPASIGEVVDKITILELKASRLSGERLANVELERQLLVGCLEAVGLAIDKEHFEKLRQINTRLWALEDDIRHMEAQQDFGSAFIALARAIYLNNDERAAVKRCINGNYGSALMEEKLYQNYH